MGHGGHEHHGCHRGVPRGFGISHSSGVLQDGRSQSRRKVVGRGVQELVLCTQERSIILVLASAQTACLRSFPQSLAVYGVALLTASIFDSHLWNVMLPIGA